jgi:hypothetical protein
MVMDWGETRTDEIVFSLGDLHNMKRQMCSASARWSQNLTIISMWDVLCDLKVIRTSRDHRDEQ